MTTISIVASGSRGDIQPYIALGQGLQRSGYDIRVLTNEGFEALVTDAGLRFYAAGPNIEAMLHSEQWRKTIENGNFLRILQQMRTEVQRGAASMARRMPDLLAGSDLILGGTSLLGMYPIAELRNTPIIQAYLLPFTPTRTFGSPLLVNLPNIGLLNRLSFLATQQLLWQSSKTMNAEVRRVLNMPKGSFWGPFGALERRPEPVLYGYSRHLLPRPADWPVHYDVTGFWYLNQPLDWTPPPDLLAFLDAGEPPIYIGFGSMRSRDPGEAGQIALDALARSGQRGVIAAGWGGLQATNLPDNVCVVDAIPHSWLFPRMKAVVHHGGVGTTAAGLRAGIPSVIVPFMGDQPFWGQRLAALGVGPAPIPRKQLSSARLADAITQSVTNTRMRQNAHALGQMIQAENGVAVAVAAIERFCQQHIQASMIPSSG